MDPIDLNRITDWVVSSVGFVVMFLAEVLGPTWNSLPEHLHDRIPHANTIGLMLFGVGLFVRLLTWRSDKKGCDHEDSDKQ